MVEGRLTRATFATRLIGGLNPEMRNQNSLEITQGLKSGEICGFNYSKFNSILFFKLGLGGSDATCQKAEKSIVGLDDYQIVGYYKNILIFAKNNGVYFLKGNLESDWEVGTICTSEA